MGSRILVVDDSATLRRVVAAILERHGYEPSVAADGAEALDALTSGAVKADLVLVDFVMPRLNGYQFCRALRDNTELAMTPVVLMSAKGDRIREMFVQQTGALDAITKPFDAQALVAVVENALRRVNVEKHKSSRKLLEMPEQEPVDPPPPPRPDQKTLRMNVSMVIAAKLAHIVTRALSDKPGASPGELAIMLTDRLAKESIAELIEALKGGEHHPVLAGDQSVIPVGSILQLLAVENQTGVLACTHDGTEVTATFRNGLVDLVQSTGAADEFRLGRYFIEEGIVTPAEIEEMLRQNGIEPPPNADDPPRSQVLARTEEGHAVVEGPPVTLRDELRLTAEGRVSAPPTTLPTPPRLLGSMLLEAGKISEGQLRSALARQSSELLYEVIRWPAGRFLFRREPASFVVESARLGLPVASVVMEGFSRVDTWRVLERTVGSFDTVLVRDEIAVQSLDAITLEEKEQQILDLVDGQRSVRKIIADAHVSSFDGCRVIVSLLEARVVRKRS